MARKQTLKVYRTAIGFHDAYVAAPSQKAALEAWGSGANLFARGMAEIVTDEELSREALASPGKVVRKLRGTAEEQLAALPPSAPTHRGKDTKHRADAEPPARESRAKSAVPKAPNPPKPPRPDRAPLDAARKALENADAQFDQARKQLAERQAELDRERRSLGQAHDEDVASLQRELERIETAYDKAMALWRS